MEHRNPKSQYRRTSGKEYIRQMARIERRQARLRRLRLVHVRSTTEPESIFASTPEAHYHIATSQNDAIDIGLFLNQSYNDPAVKVHEPCCTTTIYHSNLPLRIFGLCFRNTCCLECKRCTVWSVLVILTSTSLIWPIPHYIQVRDLTKSSTMSISKAKECTSTTYFASTLQHMMFGDDRT